MEETFDPGYGEEPWATLVASAPGPDVYPPADFRSEWGPIFHRGRLDGSARVLVIGQDPGPQESYVRRILTGEAGQRAQGFLAKLGITRSYVAINCFLYSIASQHGGEAHAAGPAIASYRNRWLDAIATSSPLEATIAFGHLADGAFQQWRGTPGGAHYRGAYAHLTHPTAPDSGGHTATARKQLMAAMLANWNGGLDQLQPAIAHPDTTPSPGRYGAALAPGDLVEIPAADWPAGLPAWMRTLEGWAGRGKGSDYDANRATLTIVIPPDLRPWTAPAPPGP
jgi:uracil-DNA glycosylase